MSPWIYVNLCADNENWVTVSLTPPTLPQDSQHLGCIGPLGDSMAMKFMTL
jgi:hypothetical protein